MPGNLTIWIAIVIWNRVKSHLHTDLDSIKSCLKLKLAILCGPAGVQMFLLTGPTCTPGYHGHFFLHPELFSVRRVLLYCQHMEQWFCWYINNKYLLCLFCRIKNDSFCDHGLKVVQHTIENEGLLAFERMWRQHFLDTMQPAYLPVLWSVDHSHSELINMGLEMKGAFCMHNLPPDSVNCWIILKIIYCNISKRKRRGNRQRA